MLALWALFMHATPLNRFFGNAPLGRDDWLAIKAFGLAPNLVEAEKYLVGYNLHGEPFKRAAREVIRDRTVPQPTGVVTGIVAGRARGEFCRRRTSSSSRARRGRSWPPSS